MTGGRRGSDRRRTSAGVPPASTVPSTAPPSVSPSVPVSDARARLAERVERHRGVVGVAAAVVAGALTVTWLVVVPEKADAAGPLQAAVLRYAHPVCWALLAAAATAWAARAPRPAVEWPARAALAAYVAFLAALAF